MSTLNSVIGAINDFIWADWTLYVLLFAGLLFTLWSRFMQVRSFTHGTQLLLGQYDDRTGPGALCHYQALSAALSGTVGIGNIGGVAIAVSLGGPGAVFWMWVVGFIAMALKFAEVTATEVDALTTLGTGVMLWVNIPLTLLLASHAMRAYRDHINRLDRGEFAAERRR